MTARVDAPWLEPARRSLRAARAADRLPHAILLHADPGTGGEELAVWAAQLVLCTGEEPRPCGRCLACRRVADDQHPDLVRLSPIEDSKQIRIDQIRELGAELALTSHAQGYKVALVIPADALNPSAANALLKTLEEPAPNTLLVLVAAQPSHLPATIRSRCQRLRVPPPTRAQSLAWLEAEQPGPNWGAALDIIGNAPFAALAADGAALASVHGETLAALAETLEGRGDPVATSERWGRGDAPAHLRSIENWLSERIRGQVAPRAHRADLRAAAHLSESGSDLNIRSLFMLLDQVRELVALLDTPVNRSLAFENLLRSFRAHARAGRN